MRDATIATCSDRWRQARPSRGAGRIVAGLAIGGACLLLARCAGEAPRQASLGDEIAIGPYSLTVLRARHAPDPPPPISTFRTERGKKGVVVFIRWGRLDSELDAMHRLAFIENVLERQLAVADADGRRSRVTGAMQDALMHMEDPGSDWRHWVTVFHVPIDSRHLTLLVDNPEPRGDQPRRIAVPLGL